MGQAFEKQIKTNEDESEKQVDALNVLVPKAIESESNKHSIAKKIYDELLQEKIDEILEMSKEINYKSLIYDKSPTSSISFTKFGGPMCTYEKLNNNSKTTLQQVKKKQKDF